tara:strand:- start:42 stop:224 length:183 start_codon:yes stop_codon:yes gene_type:complete
VSIYYNSAPHTTGSDQEGDVLNGVAAKLLTKYRGLPAPAPAEAVARARANIEDGNSWVLK